MTSAPRDTPDESLRSTVGTPPGTLTNDPSAVAPAVQVIAYGPKLHDERSVSLDELGPLVEAQRRGRGKVLWVHIVGTGNADAVRTIGELFELHPLALEDVNNGGQRPKLEDYGSQLFVVAHVLVPGDELQTEQVSLFLGCGYVVTFQEREGDCFEHVRARIRADRGRVRSVGADYLVYALLDAVIDHFSPVVDDYGDRLDALEQQVLRSPATEAVSGLLDIRHELHSLRRIAMASRKMLERMLGPELELVTQDTRTYLRDCHDHAVRLIDTIESSRDLGANLMDVHLAIAGQQLNSVMKVLTIIATIFIPLSFIASVYGMNFDRSSSPLNMPELDWYFGYPFAIGLMMCVVAGQLLYFHRKGWLRTSD